MDEEATSCAGCRPGRAAKCRNCRRVSEIEPGAMGGAGLVLRHARCGVGRDYCKAGNGAAAEHAAQLLRERGIGDLRC